MIEVAPNLFVGNGVDLMYVEKHDGFTGETSIEPGWHVITAAKEPWHREALGYTERSAPKDHPEYLIALRKNRTILNLVDAPDPAYIRDDIIDTALGLIDMQLKAGDKVLIHCNEGKSRAPTIAMLWMATNRFGMLHDRPVSEAFDRFRVMYPDYAPGEGMRLYAQARLEKMLATA